MDDARSDQIVTVLAEAYADLMAADPPAFRRRFREMAADPFTFSRGSAPLFFADVTAGSSWDDARWVDERTSRVWIHGDLHAENVGTPMDGRRVLVFDVDDFDEACLGQCSPYEADLDGEVLTEPAEMVEVLDQLGRATAKVHCVSDVDLADTPLVECQTEEAIRAVLDGREDAFVGALVEFGMAYAERVRDDHALFVAAFRAGRMPSVEPTPRSRG